MNPPLLVAENLVAGWERPVTPAVSLALAAGEIVALTGPNGVGKSTFLAALCGRARIHAGSLNQAANTRIAWQTQDIPPVLGLPLCGRDLLALTGASADGLPPWLADKLDLRLDRLSGGQRHYLSLWAVLQMPADIVLLDEPTNNLDQAGTEHLAIALRLRAKAGVGLILVSHDDIFVSGLCDRIIHMGG